MAKSEAVPNRQYTDEFKQETVRLAQSIGGNAAAKRLGVPQSTVTNWVRKASKGVLAESQGDGASLKRPVTRVGGRGQPAAARTGQHEARSRNRKKAAAYFAKESR